MAWTATPLTATVTSSALYPIRFSPRILSALPNPGKVSASVVVTTGQLWPRAKA